MSDHVFSYTDSAGTVTSITFDTAARLMSDPDVITFKDELGESLGGTEYVREYGSTKKTYQFSFIVPRAKVASELDMPAAKTFFILVGRVNTITWTDDAGTARTVRITSQTITFEPLQGKWIQCQIELKEQ